jgi:DNA invertase Pin-like site-specific DNA recombinase
MTKKKDGIMTRVVLYARYSTDVQSVASVTDQFRICRDYADRERWQVVETYHDAAISGASVILRPGVQALLQDAQRGRFDVVIAEALDRVSRDQADIATLFKHLRFAGIKIVTLAKGEVSELHVGLKGTMNALFLKDLAAKTHRGCAAGSPRASQEGAFATAMMSSSAWTAVANRSVANGLSIRRRRPSYAAFSRRSQPAVRPAPSRPI